MSMQKTTEEQMNASTQFCPNVECMARGKVGQGNIVIHGKARPRYRCKTCGKTFSAKEGTMFAGLRKPTELIVIVVTLLAYGCPTQAIVHAFGLAGRPIPTASDVPFARRSKRRRDADERACGCGQTFSLPRSSNERRKNASLKSFGG